MNEFFDLLQRFAYEVAVLTLPVIAGFVVAALKVLISKWLADIEASKPQLAYFLREAAEIAVAAAEKAHLSEFVDDKKQYALNVMQAYLNEHGWDEVDIDVLEAAIEAEVIKQFP